VVDLGLVGAHDLEADGLRLRELRPTVEEGEGVAVELDLLHEHLPGHVRVRAEGSLVGGILDGARALRVGKERQVQVGRGLSGAVEPDAGRDVRRHGFIMTGWRCTGGREGPPHDGG